MVGDQILRDRPTDLRRAYCKTAVTVDWLVGWFRF